jgi:hypothetical protein
MACCEADGANQGIVTGLPILRIPITKSFRRALGFAQKSTTVTSTSNRGYAIGRLDNITTRVRASRQDPKGDSLEELIIDSNAIEMTRTFSTHVIVKE